MICGAWGGRPDKDGLEAVTNASQNLSNMPVEVMEAEHPVRVEEYAFVPDTCGAGKWRGGVGAPAHLSHPGARGAAADAHRPRGVRALRAERRTSQAAARATSSRSATSREPLPGKVTMTVPHDARDHPRAGRRRRLRRSRCMRDPGARARRPARRQNQRGLRAPPPRRGAGRQGRRRWQCNGPAPIAIETRRRSRGRAQVAATRTIQRR